MGPRKVGKGLGLLLVVFNRFITEVLSLWAWKFLSPAAVIPEIPLIVVFPIVYNSESTAIPSISVLCARGHLSYFLPDYLQTAPCQTALTSTIYCVPPWPSSASMTSHNGPWRSLSFLEWGWRKEILPTFFFSWYNYKGNFHTKVEESDETVLIWKLSQDSMRQLVNTVLLKKKHTVLQWSVDKQIISFSYSLKRRDISGKFIGLI